MKKIVFILFAFALSTSIIVAQDVKKEPKVEFVETEHDFGKIKESDQKATHEFKFKNKGDAPFIIQRVQTSCGCTSPEYTKEPVLPGKEGSIKITYSTVGRVGRFNSDLKVFSNVAYSVFNLKIKGEVTR
ncbi:MAG: DUF1573 domain-containing protein [Prevotella sp.]|jgi:hypothetical protein|nr:DUF1573 domain-containing protein [Prevotella sp.]